MKRRFFTMLLALCLVLGLTPTALADNGAGGDNTQTYSLETGSITVTARDGKQYVTQVNGVTNEEQTGKTVITQTDKTAATTNTITIEAAENQTAHVTLSGVNIDVSSQLENVAVSTSGEGSVDIELDGENTVKSGINRAGLEKNNDGSLTITDADDNGSLKAMGGFNGAGIGGGFRGNGNGSNITITGGRINAQGGLHGAGIGSGDNDDPWENVVTNITITGGQVTATGGEQGAGIGGGQGFSGSNITISGGMVTAKGSVTGAGIGGGYKGTGSNITVSGNAQLKVQGGKKDQYYHHGVGAAIGNGGNREGDSTPIDGTKVTPDTSKLTVCGKIQYYDPGVDMETVKPTTTITGKVDSHTLVHHEAKAATCTETGNVEYWQCSVCGKKFSDKNADTEITGEVVTEKNPNHHSNLQHTEAKAATDTEGNREYWHCDGCNKYYQDAAATQETTQEETVISPVPATGLSLSQPELYLAKDKTKKLTAILAPDNSTASVTWSSSDPAIATVDGKEGIVIAIDYGTAVITAQASGHTATCKVYVVCDSDQCTHYPDVEATEWYHPAVDYVTQAGIMQGHDTGNFAPYGQLTRAEMAQILYNYQKNVVKEGKEPETGKTQIMFTDVKSGEWYEKAITWASSNGIVMGDGEGDNNTFRPDDSVSREEMVTMLYRYMVDYLGRTDFPQAATGNPDWKSFQDCEAVADWAETAFAWAVKHGIIDGDDGRLNPQCTATRAQAAKIVMVAVND